MDDTHSQVADGSPGWQVVGGRRSKGNRKPGLMLRSYVPSKSSGSPMVPPLSSASALINGASEPPGLSFASLANLPTCQPVN